MYIVRVLTLCCTLAALAGCATLSYPLPKCDGYSKRPLNRSMWEWEGGKSSTDGQQSSLTGKGSKTAAATQDATATAALAFAGFDEAGSHRACEAV